MQTLTRSGNTLAYLKRVFPDPRPRGKDGGAVVSARTSFLCRREEAIHQLEELIAVEILRRTHRVNSGR
jgi:hypothetical protein